MATIPGYTPVNDITLTANGADDITAGLVWAVLAELLNIWLFYLSDFVLTINRIVVFIIYPLVCFMKCKFHSVAGHVNLWCYLLKSLFLFPQFVIGLSY